MMTDSVYGDVSSGAGQSNLGPKPRIADVAVMRGGYWSVKGVFLTVSSLFFS